MTRALRRADPSVAGPPDEPDTAWPDDASWPVLTHQLAVLAPLALPGDDCAVSRLAERRPVDIARGFVRAVRRRDWRQTVGAGATLGRQAFLGFRPGPGTAPAAACTTASARTTSPCPPRTCCPPKSTGPAERRPLRQRACHSAGVPAGAHAPCAWWVCRHWYVTPSRVTTAPVS